MRFSDDLADFRLAGVTTDESLDEDTEGVDDPGRVWLREKAASVCAGGRRAEFNDKAIGLT